MPHYIEDGQHFNARGEKIGDYEYQRLERISRNAEHLERLGLGNKNNSAKPSMANKKKKRAKARIVQVIEPYARDEEGNPLKRTSGRLSGREGELVDGLKYDEDWETTYTTVEVRYFL